MQLISDHQRLVQSRLKTGCRPAYARATLSERPTEFFHKTTNVSQRIYTPSPTEPMLRATQRRQKRAIISDHLHDSSRNTSRVHQSTQGLTEDEKTYICGSHTPGEGMILIPNVSAQTAVGVTSCTGETCATKRITVREDSDRSRERLCFRHFPT